MNWFDTASFEGFVTAPGGRTNPNLEMALAQSMKFAEQRDHSLCIYGPPGVGKTHLCYSVRIALRAMRLPVNLISFHDMIPWLRQFSPNYERKLGAFKQVDVLVVDDLENLWFPDNTLDHLAAGTMLSILQERLEQALPTMLSSWDHPAQVFPQSSAILASSEQCMVVEIVAEDYRRLPKQDKGHG